MDASKFCEQMEAFFVKGMEEMVRNAKSVGNLSQGMEAGLEARARLDHFMKQYLESMNLPTRDDIAKLMQYLQKIESRMISLEEKVDDLADALKPPKRKPRK